MMLWLRQFKSMLIWRIYQSRVDVILEDIQLGLVIPIMYINPEIHEVGDIPQVSGRDIEDPRNGQMGMMRERMVSRDSYTSFSPETPERRQLHGSRRDEQTVPAGHLERRRSATSEEEILRGVTRGPPLFQEIP